MSVCVCNVRMPIAVCYDPYNPCLNMFYITMPTSYYNLFFILVTVIFYGDFLILGSK